MTDGPMFYHGTRRGFTPGGYLFPRAWHRGEGTTAPATGTRPDADHYVYVTTSRTLAWVYAWHAVGRGRPKVLTVRPTGDLELDPEHSPAMQAYRCDSARVLAVDINPPITEEEARDGWAM